MSRISFGHYIALDVRDEYVYDVNEVNRTDVDARHLQNASPSRVQFTADYLIVVVNTIELSNVD